MERAAPLAPSDPTRADDAPGDPVPHDGAPVDAPVAEDHAERSGTHPADPKAPSEPSEEARVASLLLALLVVTIPLATAYAIWSAPGGADDWNRRVTLAPFDLVLLLATFFVALRPRLLLDLFRSPAVRACSAALAVVGAVALVANPSWLGVALGIRLVAGLAVLALVGPAFQHAQTRTLVLGAATVAGVAQAVLGMVQSARGASFGIELLDFAGPLYPFGSSHAGRGGLTHPYHLAVFLVVAQGAALLGLRHARAQRWPWLAALAVLGAGIGVTYTRAGALGQVGLLVCLLLGRRDRSALRQAALAVAIGLAVGGLAFGDGWQARGATTTGEDGVSADSNRSVRLSEARELIEGSPLTGVGPGRYVDALAETDRIEYLPAHNLVAHEAAELGVIGGALVLALLGLLGLRVLRGGAWTAAIVVPLLPFLVLDAYPYVFATGLALSALWLGLARASLVGPDVALEPASAS